MQGWILTKGVVRNIVTAVVSDISYIKRIEKDRIYSDCCGSEVGPQLVPEMKPRCAIERISPCSAQFAQNIMLIVIDRKTKVRLTVHGIEGCISSGANFRKRRNLMLYQ